MRLNTHRIRPFFQNSYHRSAGLQRVSTWRPFRRAITTHIPSVWRSWVLDPGSLTKRLIKASHGQFKVRVVFQGLAYPTLDECMQVSLGPRQVALVREVELLCAGEPWVVARSIIPLQTLTGAERELAHLGSRPLGAFLFSAPTMRRKPLEIACFQPLELDHDGDRPQDQEVYGRRSVFLLHEKPLLVSELFLPKIIAK